MNYKELIKILSSLNEKQLQQNITIYNASCDEFFGACNYATTKENDILENDHFYLIIKG